MKRIQLWPGMIVRILYGMFLLMQVLFFQACKQAPRHSYQGPSLSGIILSSADSVSTQISIRKALSLGLKHVILSSYATRQLNSLPDSIGGLIIAAKACGAEMVSVVRPLMPSPDIFPAQARQNDTLLNLDKPEFWKAFRSGYHAFFVSAGNADGFILDLFDSDADRNILFSDGLNTAEKFSALIDSAAGMINGQWNKICFVRLNYTSPEEQSLALKVLKLCRAAKIIVIEKEVPGESLLTSPVSDIVSQIPFPVLIEFDCVHQHNGQGILASIFPGLVLKRLHFFRTLPNVIGFAGAVDRPQAPSVATNPSFVNLFTLKQGWDYPELSMDQILGQFITTYYGVSAVPHLIPVFKSAGDIIQSSLYTLGIPSMHNSSMDFEYEPNYSLNVPGRWMNVPVVVIKHGVNKEFNYWSDIVQHLAPVRFKTPGNTLLARHAGNVLRKGWVDSAEKMNIEYLNYIIKEKNYAVLLAEEAMNKIIGAKQVIADSSAYATLYQTFYRTYLTAKLYRATAKAYFGYRVYYGNEQFRNPGLKATIAEGITEMRDVMAIMRIYPYRGPAGEYNWSEDILAATNYYTKITRTGWAEYGPAMAIDDEY